MAFFPALLVPLLMAGVVVRSLGARHSTWEGTRLGDDAEVLPLADKHGRHAGTLVGVRGLPKSLSFTVRGETALDGLLKQFGIVRELETGDLAFDLAVFVESTDPFLVETLTADPSLRRSMRALVGKKLASGDFVRLNCHDGRLWIHLGARAGASEPMMAALRPFADALVALRGVILERAAGRRDFKDPSRVPVATITGINTAVAVFGYASLVLGGFRWTNAIDQDALYHAAFWPSLGAFALLFAAGVYFARRSARFHLVMLELLLIGIGGFVLAGWTTVGFLNQAVDTSPPVHVRARVDSAWVSHGRRRAPTYYADLSAEDWPAWLGNPDRVMVPHTSYGPLQSMGGAEFVVHRGAFGVPWYESVRGWAPPERDSDE